MAENSNQQLFTETELQSIENQYAEGLTLAQILDLFEKQEVRLSEATFRKYVQLGLLVRSRRIGRKGKHQGSLGVYPASTVRRLNVIRHMMAAHYTIEDIQRSFLRFTNQIETLKNGFAGLFVALIAEIQSDHFHKNTRKELTKEIKILNKEIDLLFLRIDQIERQILSPLERVAHEKTFATGMQTGADDLLG